MSETDFKISNAQWARREFPLRLAEAALRHYGRDADDRYGINAKIAEDAGVDRSAVTRWMKGAVPQAETVLRLADAYGVSPDYLVGNDSVPDSGFSLRDVEARLSYDKLIKVLRIMSELRTKVAQVDDDWFARATVEILKLNEQDPDMTEDAITGAAYRLLRNGPD